MRADQDRGLCLRGEKGKEKCLKSLPGSCVCPTLFFQSFKINSFLHKHVNVFLSLKCIMTLSFFVFSPHFEKLQKQRGLQYFLYLFFLKVGKTVLLGYILMSGCQLIRTSYKTYVKQPRHSFRC